MTDGCLFSRSCIKEFVRQINKVEVIALLGHSKTEYCSKAHENLQLVFNPLQYFRRPQQLMAEQTMNADQVTLLSLHHHVITEKTIEFLVTGSTSANKKLDLVHILENIGALTPLVLDATSLSHAKDLDVRMVECLGNAFKSLLKNCKLTGDELLKKWSSTHTFTIVVASTLLFTIIPLYGNYFDVKEHREILSKWNHYVLCSKITKLVILNTHSLDTNTETFIGLWNAQLKQKLGKIKALVHNDTLNSAHLEALQPIAFKLLTTKNKTFLPSSWSCFIIEVIIAFLCFRKIGAVWCEGTADRLQSQVKNFFLFFIATCTYSTTTTNNQCIDQIV